MAKNKQNRSVKGNNKKSVSNSPFSLPAIVSADVLATMSDDELIERFNTLVDEASSVERGNYDPTAWDIEIAYMQREFQMRQYRRFLHDKYLMATDVAEDYIEYNHDHDYNFDRNVELDNSAFVKLSDHRDMLRDFSNN